MEQGEIVIYKASDKADFQIEVRIEEETVWLTQAQMLDLFDSTKQNISLHINNIFKEGELQQNSVVKEYLTTASDGKKYKTKFYNLDVIISVGYRVKSKRGTQFRIWASSVLKDYLLRGYAINQRVDRIEKKLFEHDQKFDLLIKTNLPPHEGVFYDGQIFDAHVFVSDLIKAANQSTILIDNYIDENVLALLSKRKANVSATVYSANISHQLKLDLKRFNAQYPRIEIKQFTRSHDRFLIIDRQTIYHIGASLKDLGKKWFAFSKIGLDAREMIEKLEREKLIN
ncbi:virulence RhuM family protein [Gaoshiqia sp. Z1-71]|uniref:virulence RhuM family protein n=1 Tax=Gaoshiqia hydrogeniformans TaxID=3290090 RepID=UPI003BF88372